MTLGSGRRAHSEYPHLGASVSGDRGDTGRAERRIGRVDDSQRPDSP
jgi:hypothetical protein